MNLTSPRPYWLLQNGLGASPPLLERNRRVDVLVIGAGITGALVAEALTARGFSVLVLDSRQPGHGSTSASTALLQYEIDEHLVDLVKKVGRERAQDAYRACFYGLRTITRLARELGDVGFHRRPSLYYASKTTDVAALRAEGHARRKIGLPCETWNRADLRSLVDFEAGAALWSRAGAEIDPLKMCRALFARASKRDFSLCARTTVEALVPSARRVEVHTDRGLVQARHVVVAAGYEARRFLPRGVARLHSSYALVTEPVHPSFAGWPERCLIWESARPYLYLRTTVQQRILVGGLDQPFRDPARRDARVAGAAKRLLNEARRMFPRIEMEPAYAWGGTFGETKDGLAYIGAHPQLDPRIHFALGYGGNGITYSALAAEVLAAHIEGRRHRYGDTFSFAR